MPVIVLKLPVIAITAERIVAKVDKPIGLFFRFDHLSIYMIAQSIEVLKILVADMHAQLHRLCSHHHGFVGIALVVVLFVVFSGFTFGFALAAGVGNRQGLKQGKSGTKTGQQVMFWVNFLCSFYFQRMRFNQAQQAGYSGALSCRCLIIFYIAHSTYNCSLKLSNLDKGSRPSSQNPLILFQATLHHALPGQHDNLIVIPINQRHLHSFDLDRIKNLIHLHHLRNLLIDLRLGLLSITYHIADLALVIQIVFDFFASGGLDSLEGVLVASLGIDVVTSFCGVVSVFGFCDYLCEELLVVVLTGAEWFYGDCVDLDINDEVGIRWNAWNGSYAIGELGIDVKSALEALSAETEAILQTWQQSFPSKGISDSFLFDINHVFQVNKLFQSNELSYFRSGSCAWLHNHHLQLMRDELNPHALFQFILLKNRPQWLWFVVLICNPMPVPHLLYKISRMIWWRYYQFLCETQLFMNGRCLYSRVVQMLISFSMPQSFFFWLYSSWSLRYTFEAKKAAMHLFSLWIFRQWATRYIFLRSWQGKPERIWVICQPMGSVGLEERTLTGLGSFPPKKSMISSTRSKWQFSTKEPSLTSGLNQLLSMLSIALCSCKYSMQLSCI